jgi:hypothetical protein
LRRRRGRVDACLRRDRHRHSFRQVGCIMMGTQARAYPQMPGAPSIFLRMCVDDTGDRTSGGRTPGGRTPEVRQGRSPLPACLERLPDALSGKRLEVSRARRPGRIVRLGQTSPAPFKDAGPVFADYSPGFQMMT